MIVTIKHLHYSVGTRTILNDISMTFEGNQVYGIIGANGAGKTTLLRHLYRELPSRGTIFVDGTDIADISRREYARIAAVMMQHQDLIESDLNVYDVVRSGRYPYKTILSRYDEQDEAIITDILEKHNLLPYIFRQVSTLSGGELQRVMFCRALAQQPRMILLDEPTNHLDVRYRVELMQTLRSFDGLVIMTIHDLNLAARYCDYIYAMKDGTVRGQGQTQDMIREDVLSDLFHVPIDVLRAGGRLYVGV